MIRRFFAAAVFAAMLTIPAFSAGKPSTVIHVVTVKWKDGTTEEQIQKAIQGVEAAAKLFPGIKNIWLRSFKVQGDPIGKCEPGAAGVSHAFVMEFESEQALKEYANSEAQKAFYKVYLPHRDESRTHDISN
jgi:hypothetical protein